MRLKAALAALPQKERDARAEYFGRLIDERVRAGATEEQAVSELDDVYAAAERIKNEAGIRQRTGKGLGIGAIIGIIAGSLALLLVVVLLIGTVTTVRLGQGVVQDVNTNRPADIEQSAQPGEFFEYSFSEPVNLFKLELATNYIELLPSNDDSFHLSYYVTKDAPLELRENNGTITLEDPTKNEWTGSLTLGNSWQTAENTVRLFIPAGSDVNLEAGTVSGAIYSAGITVRNADIANVSGGIDLDDLVCHGELNIATVSGELDLDYVSADNISIAGTSGYTELEGVTTGDLDIATVSGEVNIEETSFMFLSCASVSGDLTGSLLGRREDYSVRFDSLSGDNYLGNLSVGNIVIEYSSVSGNLDMGFGD
jgi:hypothetical protein